MSLNDAQFWDHDEVMMLTPEVYTKCNILTICLENKLHLISINFTPKTSNPVALKIWYFPMFSR